MQAQLHLPSSGCKHRGPPSAARMSPILYRRSGWGGFYQLGGPASPVPDSLLSVFTLSSPGATARLGPRGPQSSLGDSQNLGYV